MNYIVNCGNMNKEDAHEVVKFLQDKGYVISDCFQHDNDTNVYLLWKYNVEIVKE